MISALLAILGAVAGYYLGRRRPPTNELPTAWRWVQTAESSFTLLDELDRVRARVMRHGGEWSSNVCDGHYGDPAPLMHRTVAALRDVGFPEPVKGTP